MPSLREIMAKKAGAASKAAPAKPSGGMKLFDPAAPQPGEQSAPPPKAEEQGRQLDQTKATGEEIPMDFPSANGSDTEKLWWQARHALDHELVIWVDPASDHGWLAVKGPKPTEAPLILLQRLPLANNPKDDEPF